jgi:prolyl oligopeptidase
MTGVMDSDETSSGAGGGTSGVTAPGAGDSDPRLWLEEVTGEAALDWVRERSAATVADLTSGPDFAGLREDIREVLDSDDRIPYARRRGEYLYNYWQDAAHPRGLWRRTTLDSYRLAQPDWDVLLDLDALAETEKENWVWHGAAVLRPGYRRALVQLSRGGADATVVREFDLTERAFVADGFSLPEAKSYLAWIDLDHVYVGTDFGAGSLTSSGYPRIAKLWQRGTPLSEATLVFEAKPEDVSTSAWHDDTDGFERDFVLRRTDFYTAERFQRLADGELVKLDLPNDVDFSVEREWMTVRTRSAWTVGGTTYPAGALLAGKFDEFMAGHRDFTVLFEPDAHTSLEDYAWTRDHLLLGLLHDVSGRLEVLTPADGDWTRQELEGAPEHGDINIMGTSPERDNEFWVTSSSFTEPATLRRGVIGEPLEVVKQGPAAFDAGGLEVRQHFATSADGTKIPYYVVADPSRTDAPTLLGGYGGFEVSNTPGYSGVIGRGWLAHGGTYVLANIRGGGEYGPDWHTSVIKAKRYKVYEDFAAVARDLVERGITTPERLGIQGGSNGGLLMGVMLTSYPELFGAIVCQVPLLDMRRYHQLLAGASWMAEYGDPDDETEWEFISRYSPYHNVRSGQKYPPTLFATSTRDDRVHPGHARKMAALLEETGYRVWYYENIEGGHSGAADNEQAAFRWALVFDFLRQKLTGRPAAG